MKHLYKTIDLHCDTILALQEKEEKQLSCCFDLNDLHVDLHKLKAGDVVIQTTALFTDRLSGRQPEHQALRLYRQFRKVLKENPDLLQVKTRKDLQECWDGRKTGLLLSLEEGDVMFQDLDLLDLWYDFGVRIIAPCWNYPNALGHPNFTVDENWDYHQGNPMLILETEKGLTEHGKAYVRKMEELGILVDVSHLGDAGFWDVIKMAKRPVIATHSNARGLRPVSRNLSDEMLKAIAGTGGLAGLNFCADFLKSDSHNRSGISDMVRHILYMRDLIGSGHIALGTDFDGIHSELEIEDASQIQKLWQALKEAGLSEEEIDNIAGKNAYRLLHQILPD